MNVMASVEPVASAAIWSSVATVASLVRYMATPVEATTAGWPASKPAVTSRSHQDGARLEVDRHQPQPLWDAEAELDQALPLPGLGTRLVDFEHPQAGRDRRPALREGVQAGSEDDVLADAP